MFLLLHKNEDYVGSTTKIGICILAILAKKFLYEKET
jgi:hypothetical protein